VTKFLHHQSAISLICVAFVGYLLYKTPLSKRWYTQDPDANRPPFVLCFPEMIGVVCGEGRAPFFDQSVGQNVRGRENSSIPAYLSKSAQAFPPEFVGRWYRVQGLEYHRSAIAGGEPPAAFLTLSKKFAKPRTSESLRVDTKYPYPSKWRKLLRTRRDSGADKFNLRRRCRTSPADMVVAAWGREGVEGRARGVKSERVHWLVYTNHKGPYQWYRTGPL